MNKTMKFKVTKYEGEYKQLIDESAVCEYPLNIFLNGRYLTTLLCTPEKIKELTVGFLAFRGIITDFDQIKSIEVDSKNGISKVVLKDGSFDSSLHSKQMLYHNFNGCRQGEIFSHIMDSMGIDKIKGDNIHIDSGKIYELMKKSLSYSEAFKITGGVQCAVLCDENDVIFICEDVARHNALDKLTGESLIKKISLRDKMLFVSSRVSFEMMLKIARLGVPIVASKSAPTDLSIKFAEELNLTLLGFVRGRRMNIYTNPQRIK
ncbi:formate dehydrogenase accessory sulfurtransferase FdhD [Clostridium luticellarii]|jgi:FdhD protein|uniref:Sulfur carrier protein FdhD n=1 Tax=Clostridium luticellarii TaxID=1691940 RepID=A0A2T0BM77_9CLOT|nr:formate dehydrogenase accessory sulfurtransferase FdhD [Clostridium luticellarii]MCI1945039.1 formate dehydrogenase accessory sulfurtransferase FdhD [Clostridium luticellarii]MCI1967562.1 formate dehydrogenase accessory sulfurtransferase FdhD [Clostridium luticellarii]MCI1995740.1 formate dehydrogenase accessory sulfurtransferase FdhD [Clostridium luticellarii]MCI2040078.1 formate dehydrogenase accessory sulfurtransferase FdhD [Clostridium luticellarii]PRR84977.1 formate dehydrogenase acces